MLPPIYQDHGKTYQADTCVPLEQAVRQGRLRQVALARGQYPGRKLARNALPGVRSVGFWDAVEPQDWGLDWHRNEGIELTFLESGSLDFAVDEFRCRMKPDDFAVTRPWQLHRVGDPYVGSGRLHCLILDLGVRRPHQPWRWPSWIVLAKEDLRQLTEILRHNEQPLWHATPEVRGCFKRIAQAVASGATGSNISRLTVYLNELLVLVLDMLRQAHVALDESLASRQRTIELFWADLRANLDHLGLEWTVGTMARRCGLGVTHFIHHSKQLNNMTPAQYLNHCRLEAAARLLREKPEWSITQVAVACGFLFEPVFRHLVRAEIPLPAPRLSPRQRPMNEMTGIFFLGPREK